MRKSTVVKKIETYLETQNKITKLQRDLAEIKKDLISEAVKNNGRLEIDGYTVTYTTFLRSTFNMTVFKKRCKKMYQRFLESKESSMFTVK